MSRPLLFGVLNVTPDSFSDGGRWPTVKEAVDAALRLADEGADVIDVGGESTRPGAALVASGEEAARVLPVVAALVRARPGLVVSVDTSRRAVAEPAFDAGATILNDVRALDELALRTWAATHGVTVVLMHRHGEPQTMMRHPMEGDVVDGVLLGLRKVVARAREAGIAPSSIRVDPGLGFGKRSEDNPRLIAALPRLCALGYPVLVGASRKRFVGDLSGVPTPSERAAGSVGAALAAVAGGAWALRVHDVAATRQALDVFLACRP